MAIIPNTPYDTMSLPELRAELAIWERAVNAGWAAHDVAARTCRDRCAYWVARREAEAAETGETKGRAA